MPDVPHDTFGFHCFCERSQLAWLRVRLVRSWAIEEVFPFPRRQELPGGSYVVGAPPAGVRRFVVSHGWESEMHPSPGGGKMRKLAAALQILEAKDDDLVFFDFCSNSQAAKMGTEILEADKPVTPGDGNPPPRPQRNGSSGPYFKVNGVTAMLKDRTHEQSAAFGYAMWDMGRLYSFEECEVIVLPELDLLDSFPGGDVWGDVNSRLYQNRGWCCAEFAIARYNERIANLSDPAVQAVLKSRKWPSGDTAQACAMYAEMMKSTTIKGMSKDVCEISELSFDPELGVDFTNKGDRDAVKYNFFKMTISTENIGMGRT